MFPWQPLLQFFRVVFVTSDSFVSVSCPSSARGRAFVLVTTADVCCRRRPFSRMFAARLRLRKELCSTSFTALVGKVVLLHMVLFRLVESLGIYVQCCCLTRRRRNPFHPPKAVQFVVTTNGGRDARTILYHYSPEQRMWMTRTEMSRNSVFLTHWILRERRCRENFVG